MLVNLWLENTTKSAPDIQASDGDLLRFHNICVSLNERTKDCLNRAEPAERPSSSLSVKWEELVEQLQGTSFEAGRGAATRNRGSIKEEDQEPLSPGTGEEYSSSSASTPITMKPAPRSRHQQNSSISASASSVKSNNSNTVSFSQNTFSPKAWASRYATSTNDTQSASASASASVSAAEETPPGSSDGMHMAPAPSYPPTLSQSSISYAHETPRSATCPPQSAGEHSLEGSETGSIQEEEYPTALPAFSKEKEKENGGKEKDKKDRGLRGVLPFAKRRKDKDREKDKDKEDRKEREKEERREREREREERKEKKEREKDRDKDKDKDKSRDRSVDLNVSASSSRGPSAMGDYASLRSKSEKSSRTALGALTYGEKLGGSGSAPFGLGTGGWGVSTSTVTAGASNFTSTSTTISTGVSTSNDDHDDDHYHQQNNSSNSNNGHKVTWEKSALAGLREKERGASSFRDEEHGPHHHHNHNHHFHYNKHRDRERDKDEEF